MPTWSTRLDEDFVDVVLPHLAQAEREDIRRLASYEPGTAGAVMTTDYVTLPAHITVREALERLRHEAPDRETIYYCYVVDHNRRLIGFVSLKNLILSRRSAHDRRHHAARRHLRPRRRRPGDRSPARSTSTTCSPCPIVDSTDRLVGIITHDDAMDILRQEQTEDILAFGGVSPDPEADEAPYWQGRIVDVVRRRIGWLLLLFLAGTLTQFVSQSFNWRRFHVPRPRVRLHPAHDRHRGQRRQPDRRHDHPRPGPGRNQARAMLSACSIREWLTGVLLGTLLGALGFCLHLVLHWATRPIFALVIGLAILGICMWANSVGALVPLARQDAWASTPPSSPPPSSAPWSTPRGWSSSTRSRSCCLIKLAR